MCHVLYEEVFGFEMCQHLFLSHNPNALVCMNNAHSVQGFCFCSPLKTGISWGRSMAQLRRIKFLKSGSFPLQINIEFWIKSLYTKFWGMLALSCSIWLSFTVLNGCWREAGWSLCTRTYSTKIWRQYGLAAAGRLMLQVEKVTHPSTWDHILWLEVNPLASSWSSLKVSLDLVTSYRETWAGMYSWYMKIIFLLYL